MQRRLFLRVAGGGTIAAATLTMSAFTFSSDMPAEAVQAWSGPGAESDIRRWILSWAILAPHSHNLQSWLVDLSKPDEITLFCDRTRLLPETDPMSRQMMVSQGTFLELLDIAARERGRRAVIELFPEGEFGPVVDARPTARIKLIADSNLKRDPLFAQIALRHTNRGAYESRVPEASALAAIESAASLNSARVGFVSASDATLIAQHRAIASDAWRIELTTPRTILESYKVLRIGPSEIAQHRDGLSINTPMVRALTALGLFDRTKAPAPDDTATQSQLDEFNTNIQTTPAFFWLTTSANDRKTQINAGRAYVRAQLAATAQGLVMHPLSQALQEYPEQAKPYSRIHELVRAQGETVQMWTRLGYAKAAQPAPRRALDSFILRA